MATVNNDGFIDKYSFSRLNVFSTHTANERIFKVTNAGFSSLYSLRELYELYLYGSVTAINITYVYRYENGRTVSKNGGCQVYTDTDGNIYIKQPAYQAIAVRAIASREGVKLTLMPDDILSSLTEVL